MTLPELSVNRYVLAFMLNALIVLFGIVAYNRIGVDQYPRVDFPMVSISTALPGANPDVIDASVTGIIETAVNSVPGIDNIQSSSSPGVSVVRIQFHLEKDIDIAFNEVQAKINQILRNLPADAEPPVVAKVEVGASPVMWLALSGDRTLQQLNQYARNVVKKRLETIDGVGEVRLGGRRDRTIRLEADLDRMNALGVTPLDLRDAFAREHLQSPGGFLVSGRTERMIRLDLEFHSPTEIEDMIVRHQAGAAIRVRDFATVVDGLADLRQVARFNGQPTIGLGIVKVSNANTVAVVEEVERRLAAEIRPQLPPGLTITAATNDADVIRGIVSNLQSHLIEGTLLAGLVVWFFLRSFRATLIVATAIPVSLLGAVALIFFFGFTFNQMTLLALLLLIGVVVDDAIVVLENIFRHREALGADPLTAAREGANEVVFAVVAATLTLVSIFAPVIFIQGVVGRFFESFAVVVTAGVLISLLVSVTLTPMLCSRFLVVSRQHGAVYRALDAVHAGLDRIYRRLLHLALGYRWWVVAATLACVASSGALFTVIAKEFMPQRDESRFIVNFRSPLGMSIEATNEYLADIEAALAQYPEISGSFAAIGSDASGQVNRGVAFVSLVPKSERSISQPELIRDLQRNLSRIAGVRAFVTEPSPIGGQRGEPLQFSITGPELARIAELGNAMYDRLRADARMGSIDMDLQLDLPQVDIVVDRERAADLGLTAADVALAVNMLAGGVDIAKYNDNPGDGERYDLRVKAREGQLRTAEDLKRIMLRARDGALVRLDAVADAVITVGPAVINRFDLQYAAKYYVAPQVPMSDALSIVFDTARELLPLGYQVKLEGQAEEFARTSGNLSFAFGMAIVLVFMVLASQFNSFAQPLIVMLAQPLAVIGGLAALWLTGKSLNIYSMIGMILLIGLVAKNSILLVDLTNQLRAQGMAVDEALREACPRRLRPVLMTSLTIILALTPAALGYTAGAETNAPMAIAIIGGMLTSTLLTLVVVPAVYSLALGRRQSSFATASPSMSD
ncbi:MAG: efflux RND transporter permease subunit [Pseudomonadales bacterium]